MHCLHACYWQVGLHWSKLLTLRLSSTVKLVGSTISCEPAWEGGNTANEKRQNAHVQSYVMATDQVSPFIAVWTKTLGPHESLVSWLTDSFFVKAGRSKGTAR